MVDWGASGIQPGADMRILQQTDRKINTVGIDDHELTGLDVVIAAAPFESQKGPVIGSFHEYAHLGKEDLFRAAGQMEWVTARLMTDPGLLEVPREWNSWRMCDPIFN